MTTGAGNSFLPKWQVALAIGAPVALGFGYMYYKNSSKSSSKSDADESESKKNVNSKGKQISIDGETVTKSSTCSSNETPSEKAQRFKNEGNVLFKASKYDQAIACYNQAIDVCPQDNVDDLATFYQNRAAAYGMLEKFDSVKADCTKALELKPQYVKALLRRARALERCNELELALQDATAVCILERYNNTNALYLADGVLKQLGKQHADEHSAKKKRLMRSKHFIKTYMISFYRDPILDFLEISEENLSPGCLKIQKAFNNQKYDDIIQLCTEELDSIHSDGSSHEMEILLLRATFYLLLGSLDKAHLDFQRIVDSKTASSNVKVNALIKRGSLYIQLEDTEKGFNDFKTAVEIDPDCGDIYHHRGQVNLILEKIDDAKADFEKAVELHPDFPIAYVQKCYTDYRYGVVYRNPTYIENSIKCFEEAMKKFPDCTECYTLYAQLLSETGNYSEADTVFAKALDIDPKNASVYVHRGLLQLQWDGNSDKCIEYINKGLEFDDKCQFGYETWGTIEVRRGNFEKAIELFDKALELSQTSIELIHIFSLKDAAKAELAARERLGLNLINNS